MKNSQKWAICLVLLIIIGSGIFYLKKAPLPKEVVLEKAEPVVSSATETVIEKKEEKNSNLDQNLRDKYNAEAKRIRDLERKALGSDGTYVTECASPKSFQRPNEINLDEKKGLIAVYNEDFYEIRGVNQGEVGYQLGNCVPDLSLGFEEDKLKNVSAITSYSINYNYHYNKIREGEVCGITDAAVGLNMLVVYPKWTGQWDGTSPPDTNINLNERWAEFISYFRFHENMHVSLNKQYAQEFLSYLEDLSEADKCVDEKYIQERFDEIMVRLNHANDKFDEEELKKDTGWHLNY